MPSSLRTAGVLGLFAAMVAIGLGSAWLASRQPAIGPGAGAPAPIAIGLATGMLLAAAGCVALLVYPSERFGRLAVGAALAWFASGWLSPGTGSPVLFTVGLVLAAAWPAIVAHMALGYRTRSLDQGARVAVLLGYVVCIGMIGLVPALLGTPGGLCAVCPSNLMAVAAAPDAGRVVGSFGLALGAVWSALAIVAGTSRLAHMTPAGRRGTLPVVAPALVVVGLFGVDAARNISAGAIAVDPLGRTIWVLEAAALVALATGSVSRIVRNRRTRAAVADIVLELAASTAAGGLQDRLRGLLNDASLVLAYPTRDGRLVDVLGSPRSLEVAPDRLVTPLVRKGDVIAVIEHRRDLDLDADRLAEIAGAASLALEHERLVAESRAHLADLRASRARVVEAGDRERRRLERDLHDGAQQRLVSLSIGLRLARARVAGASPEVTRALETAEDEVRAVILEVREIGHGIYPAILGDLGLAAAVGAFADESPIPFAVQAMPAERLRASVESAAYLLISQVPGLSRARRARIRGDVLDDRLRIVIDLEDAAMPDSTSLTDLEDRIGAIDGHFGASAVGSSLQVRAEIPCAS